MAKHAALYEYTDAEYDAQYFGVWKPSYRHRASGLWNYTRPDHSYDFEYVWVPAEPGTPRPISDQNIKPHRSFDNVQVWYRKDPTKTPRSFGIRG
jgi:hypothetical protein